MLCYVTQGLNLEWHNVITSNKDVAMVQQRMHTDVAGVSKDVQELSTECYTTIFRYVTGVTKDVTGVSQSVTGVSKECDAIFRH
jgi:hypothetical protein